MATTPPNNRQLPIRARIVLATFNLLYTNSFLYWLASTIPFAGQWRTWQRLTLPRLQGHDILELGCGTGWLLGDMLAAGYNCQAIDASPQMVAAALRVVRRRTGRDGATIVQRATAQQLPFADASFDSVVSTFPAPYITDPATIHEIVRVLRPGGKLIIVEGAALLPIGPILKLLVHIQRLVYGRSAVVGPPSPADQQTTKQQFSLPDAQLTAYREVVSGPFWQAYLVIGQRDAN